MDEYILDDNELTAEDVVDSTESVISDSGDSENTVGADSDRVSDSSDSVSVSDVTSEADTTSEENEDGIESEEQTESGIIFNDELGAYPVYIVEDSTENDIVTYASYSDYYTYLPTQIESYFSGVLDNIGDTDYVAFAYRHYYNDYNNSYIDYYRLVYDVDLQDDVLVSGSYPCITVSKDSSYNSGYNQVEETYNLSSVPSFAYGSFGHISDLREGVSHNETWTILFFLGFFAVYCVCRGIFDFVLHRFK